MYVYKSNTAVFYPLIDSAFNKISYLCARTFLSRAYIIIGVRRAEDVNTAKITNKKYMKNLKLFLTLICFVLVSAVGRAADVSGALTNVADPTITYQSVDANNNKITLSAKLYYKDNQDVDFIVLNNHPTITHNDGCPTGDKPQMEAIKYMISEGALVICPDYIGFGETSGIVHPYMCATLTARNVLDCFKAAVEYVKKQTYTKSRKTYNINIKSNYYTINIGYSQGGAVALAFQRYLETKATDAERKLVNLAGSVCGAGPYSQNILFDEYEKMTTLDYPVLMLYVLRGHKEAFGQTTMRDLELKDCFTPEFWEYYTKTLKAMMDDKATNVDDINKAIKDAGFTTFSSIMHADYADRNSKVYRTIHKTLEQSNLLADGWTPTAPITFYHDKKGNDKVVPYAETTKAMTRFKDHCSYVDAQDDYGYDGSGKYYVVTVVVTGENYLWHPAIFRETYGDPTGQHQGQNTIMTLASLTGNEKYKFSDLDHRTFGARFYAQFLGVRQSLRPNLSSAEYFDIKSNAKKSFAYYFDNYVKGKGTANNSKVDIATPVTKAYTATEASTAGNFDVITTAMPYALPAEKPVFVQFAANVDGYYFGCDAERYEVTLNAAGEVETYTPMDDLADFEAGKIYLVTPSKDETTPVVSMTAGLTTASVACLLDWRTLNIRPVNDFNDKSYATAYMPFAYESAVAYAGKVNSSYDHIILSPATEVPVGTGIVLVVDDAGAKTTYLKPVFNTSASVDTDIRGTYTTKANSGYLTFGRNNAQTEVGFYKYTGATIKPFSCYLPAPASSNALAISYDENQLTGIAAPAFSSQPAAIFTPDGRSIGSLQRGTNIIRMSDGTTKKVFIK